MKPTSDDFEPRRDGWFEHKGTWGEVVVGTVLADPSGLRTPRWEVIEVAHGQQVEAGYTLWMRIRDQVSGDVHTVKPRMKTAAVKILTEHPADTSTGEPTKPSDTEAIERLIRELGAERLATRDHTTGEITCPDYASGRNHLDEHGGGALQRGEIEHLRFAHGLSVDDDISLIDLAQLHGQAHNPKFPEVGKGGFPHRHVPEDLSIL